MGLGLYFSEGEGPKFKNPIQNLQTIEQLPTDLNNDLTYVFDGVSTMGCRVTSQASCGFLHKLIKSPAFLRVARYSGK
jgi:uroporphyrinogen decarboxylase